jgi:hypothetical protein
MRRRAWVAVVLGAVLLMVTPAGAQTVVPSAEDAVEGTVDTVTSTATDAGSAVNDTVDSVTGTASDAGDAVGDTVDTVTSTAGQAAGAVQGGAGGATGSAATSVAAPVTGTNSGAGGSTSGGGSTSSGSSTTSGSSGGSASSSRRGDGSSGSRATRHRTKFDRLPRRFETLLERIEFGRNVRANIRRLEHLLASASPAVRARVLRLLRAEIRRLRADGVTKAERSRIERLQLTRKALRSGPAAPQSSPAAAAAASSGASPLQAAVAPEASVDGSPRTRVLPEPPGVGGVLGERTGDGRPRADAGGSRGETGNGRLSPVPQLPARPDEFPFAIGLILLALVGLGLAGVVAGVAAHVVGRARSG